MNKAVVGSSYRIFLHEVRAMAWLACVNELKAGENRKSNARRISVAAYTLACCICNCGLDA